MACGSTAVRGLLPQLLQAVQLLYEQRLRVWAFLVSVTSFGLVDNSLYYILHAE